MSEIVCKKCGLIDDYFIVEKSGQQTCWCNGCTSFINNKMKDNFSPIIYFGKFKGFHIEDVPKYYLQWVLTQNFSASLKSKIKAHLDNE
jgi:hypothetical protein